MKYKALQRYRSMNDLFTFHRFGLSLSRGRVMSSKKKSPLSPVFYRVRFRLRSYHKIFFASLLHTSKWVGSGQTPLRLPQSQSHMHPQTHLLQFVLRVLYSFDHLD